MKVCSVTVCTVSMHLKYLKILDIENEVTVLLCNRNPRNKIVSDWVPTENFVCIIFMMHQCLWKRRNGKSS